MLALYVYVFLWAGEKQREKNNAPFHNFLFFHFLLIRMHSFSSLSQSLIPEISQSQPEFTFNDTAATDSSHMDSAAAAAAEAS